VVFLAGVASFTGETFTGLAFAAFPLAEVFLTGVAFLTGEALIAFLDVLDLAGVATFTGDSSFLAATAFSRVAFTFFAGLGLLAGEGEAFLFTAARPLLAGASGVCSTSLATFFEVFLTGVAFLGVALAGEAAALPRVVLAAFLGLAFAGDGEAFLAATFLVAVTFLTGDSTSGSV
jgi:hypothetical protein